MHVTRKTNQELVLLDSSVWISVFLLCASTFVIYRVLVQEGDKKGFWLISFFLLFVLLFWRKEVVVFDAARQQAIWTRRRLFSVATGTVPFSEITGIGMEATSSDRALIYRLTILTAHGSTPMSDSYAGGRQKYESLRQEILDFLKLDHSEASSGSSSVNDEASVLSLLQQGRRIEAIQLARTTQNLSLTEAHDRVTALEEQMKTNK